MKAYVFSREPDLIKRIGGVSEVQRVFVTIAGGTPTEDLVVALYLTPWGNDWAGVYCGARKNANDFTVGQGRWSAIHGFSLPPDLPPQYKLIRMKFGMCGRRYPRHERDRYGWEYSYPSFAAHLAHLFAHELYHYRREIGLESGGEQAACKWSDERATTVGFVVSSKRLPCKRRLRTPAIASLPAGVTAAYFDRMLRVLNRLTPAQLKDLQAHAGARVNELDRRERYRAVTDHVLQIKSLPSGAEIHIRPGVRDTFAGQAVTKIGNLRSNRRVQVRTPDGKEWRYPISWLSLSADVS